LILSAHGIHLELPAGWSGQAFSRQGLARVHAGDFPLALGDGEFGDESTSRMPQPATFLALAEYRPGAGLEPGRGLFESHKLPLPLDPAAFSPTGLAHPRPGQAGMRGGRSASTWCWRARGQSGAGSCWRPTGCCGR
jgi:hypothetical protein